MRGIVGAGLAGVIGAAILLAPAGVARADVTELCQFDGERLAEISGLAYSTLHEGIVWAHNDSGGGARLYALDVEQCEIRAVLRVRGIAAQDPEAIALGTGPTGSPALWWADVGDNTSSRRFVEIHQIAEPARLRSATVSATTTRVRLEDRQDSEALLADGDRLWLPPNREARARVVGTEEALVTDAAMRPGGGYAVRDYSEVRIYSGLPPGTLVSRMPLPEQVQGEAMTWTPDGTALIIASEGDERLLQVTVDAPIEGSDPNRADATTTKPESSPASEPATPTNPPTPTDAPTPVSPSPVAAALEPVDRVGSLAVLALAIGAGVFIASAAAVAVVIRARNRS